jgi:hypothetical protein
MHKLFHYYYIYLIPILLGAVFSLKSFKLEWPKAYRIFCFYLILTLLTEIFALGWKWGWHKEWKYTANNVWIYNAFYILQYSALFLFYYRILYSTRAKKMIRFISPFLIFFGIVNYFFIQTPVSMNSYTVVLTNIFSVLLALYFFREVLNQPRLISLSKSPMVWISAGTLIYCSGSLPYFIFMNYLNDNYKSMSLTLFYIFTTLNIILYTFYSIAFLCRPPSLK